MGRQIRILSANCRGLQCHMKRVDVLNYFGAQDVNIICLQDTHWPDSQSKSIRKIWNNECIIHGNSTNSRGTAILFKNNFEYKILDEKRDGLGNWIKLDLKIENKFNLRLINVYAPNSDSCSFIEEIDNLLQNNNMEHIIITGDLNIVLEPKLDSDNYVNINNPQNRTGFINLRNNYDLIDCFRYLYPDVMKYTWRRTHPIKQARLDYFLVSNHMLDVVASCNILSSYRSDHSPIELTLKLNDFTKGCGVWKFNSSLLEDNSYIDLITNSIKEEVLGYLPPVYNLQNIDQISPDQLHFTINPNLFLEVLLLRMRRETIQYSGRLKREKDKNEKLLLNEIELLETVNLQLNSSLLAIKKQDLEQLRLDKIKGIIVRSRVKWLEEGERPTKYFCELESKNYLNKTIMKLKTGGTVLTDQKTILENIKQFYSNLFENKDYTLEEIDLNNLFKDHTIKRLDLREAVKNDGYLSIHELGTALKNMKNGRSPGIDGFSCEFFKVFWSKLKHFIHKSINYSFDEGSLPLTLRRCLLTCLPKGNKPREFIKNWRPVSLLSVIYKIASSAVANRIKPLLDGIIDREQTGFMSGRYIGENTRLLYDIMHQCEIKNLAGILMLIDFEKAFDSVSWRFLYKVFHFYNFSDNLISWLKLLNSNIESSILQYGHMSQFFSIGRGCRQGDPIASFEFLPCVQIMCSMIMTNKHITGIFVEGTEYKLSQFADDTTLLLDDNPFSLHAALNTIEIFGSFSGLKINKDKTKVVWIGKKKHSKDKLCSELDLVWGNTEFDLLGIRFHVDLEKMIELNYENYLIKSRKLVSAWNKRYLTPLGKITVIKCFLLGNFTHLFSALPSPNKIFLKKLEQMLFKFLWDDKPDKLKREQICLPYHQGGLNMINIKSFIASLKISWIRRLYMCSDTPWVGLFDATITKLLGLFDHGLQYTQHIAKKTLNPFWKEVLLDWGQFLDVTIPDTMLSPLWWNPNISNKPMFFNSWYKKGIKIVGDICDINGLMKTQQNICKEFDVSPIDFISFHAFKISLNIFLRDQLDIVEHESNIRPYYPKPLRILLRDKTGIRNIKKVFNTDRTVFYSDKWSRDLNIPLDRHSWVQAYQICFHTIKDNYLIYFQYRVLNRILGVKYLRKKMGLEHNELCSLCGKYPETLLHLFCICENSSMIWRELSSWINNKTGISLQFEPVVVIMGYTHTTNINPTINLLIMITKSYLFHCSKKNISPNIFSIIKRVQQSYNYHLAISQKNLEEEKYIVKWSLCKQLLDDDP